MLVVAGTAATIASAGHELGLIATSALVTQLGLVALTPVLVAAVARLAARLPCRSGSPPGTPCATGAARRPPSPR
ncbi:hypothetical protein GCM10027612_21590 [Microbispora bryophytorum subsp. camponoti]